MKRKSFWGSFLPLMALFLAPIIITIILVTCLPSVYENTFLGELGVKYDRLTEGDDRKLVIVSGSSAAFGLDSKLLEEQTGLKTVNFGLYANLGTKLMMDLSKANVNEGDIYILAPEMNSQTLSLYFNGETAIQSMDGRLGMLFDVESSDREALLGAMWGHAANKLGYAISGTTPENSGAYKKENFNEYGDNIYSRPYKEIVGYGNAISFDFGAEYDEFIDYVNEYVEYIREEGGEVYFSFPPMNEDAVYAASTDSQITDFYIDLCSRLDCKVISDIYDYILDGGYFFDSEFHLNDSGVIIRTVQLADDIKRELGDESITVPLSDLPEPTGNKPDTDELILIKLKSGKGWAISGLTDEGKALQALYIPEEISGLPVAEIRSGSFEGASAKLIELSSSITRVEENPFLGASQLSAVVIPEGMSAEALPENNLGDGFKLYVSDVKAYSQKGYASIVEETELFTSRSYEFAGDTYRRITGLTDLGKLYTKLTLPEKIRGREIGMIEEGAFDGSALRELDMGSYSIDIVDVSKLGGITLNVGYEEYDRIKSDPAYAEYMDNIKTDNIYFKLGENEDGSLVITGLTEDGMSIDELVIPERISGKSVRTISENAFADSSIKVLHISKSISRIDGRAFAGSNIEAVIMPDGIAPDKISVPNNMSESKATDGALDILTFYVPDVYYEAYAADYFWGDYGSQLKKASEYK